MNKATQRAMQTMSPVMECTEQMKPQKQSKLMAAELGEESIEVIAKGHKLLFWRKMKCFKIDGSGSLTAHQK